MCIMIKYVPLAIQLISSFTYTNNSRGRIAMCNMIRYVPVVIQIISGFTYQQLQSHQF